MIVSKGGTNLADLDALGFFNYEVKLTLQNLNAILTNGFVKSNVNLFWRYEMNHVNYFWVDLGTIYMGECISVTDIAHLLG